MGFQYNQLCKYKHQRHFVRDKQHLNHRDLVNMGYELQQDNLVEQLNTDQTDHPYIQSNSSTLAYD
jgi:hypothetical protein